MGVFLRWGIVGILSVAALMYVYNASKRLAAAHELNPAPKPVAAEPEPEEPEGPEEPVEDPPPAQAVLSPHCEVELLVARRAVDLRQQSEPLDRVLRMQEIAWQEPAERRQRLEQVATRWYEYAEPINAEALTAAVVKDCEPTAP